MRLIHGHCGSCNIDLIMDGMYIVHLFTILNAPYQYTYVAYMIGKSDATTGPISIFSHQWGINSLRYNLCHSGVKPTC